MGRTLPDVICPSLGQGTRDGEPLVATIAQSTTFCRDAVGSDPEHQYSRVSNPTVATLEDALGALEDAPRALCFATGLAAETALFLAILRQGDHVVCGRSVYGGTTRLLQQVLSELGVESTFVDTTDLDAVQEACTPATRLVFIESPANPTLDVTDIRACAKIAHENGALLAVDNTFLTPVLQQPLDLGADVSVYSTTKFIEGHSVALGGSIVSRDQGLLDRVAFIRKCTGAIQNPFNAWLTLQGLRTLPIRIRHQSANASEIAAWLRERPEIEAVHYPEHDFDQHLGADGAVVSFEIVGGLDAGRAFVERLERCALVEHVGSTQTLVTHPASMTHADVPPEQRRAVGLGDGLLRLSVGLEPASSIIEDLEQALVQVKEAIACPV